MPARKTTILVADDDPQLLRLVTRNLQQAGYEVVAVKDGQAALEQIEAHAPDLMLLDIIPISPQLLSFSEALRAPVKQRR